VDDEPVLRAALDRVAGYAAGPPLPPVPGRPSYRISLNENSYPPLPGVLAAVAEAATRLNRYPDLYAGRLTAALAERLEQPAERILVGAGSNRLLCQILSATCTEADEVVHAWRSFEAYPQNVGISGATAVPVPLDPDLRHDLPAMAAAVGPCTRVVLLCSPNNPTGPVVRTDELERFLTGVPRRVLVVLDEAYLHFNRDPEAADGLRLLDRHPNLLTVRTFSKAYGLAGLRVGFLLAQSRVTDAVRRSGVPFAVPEIAQAAALASLAAEPELLARVDALVAERQRLTDGLRGLRWRLPQSEANFVWLPLGAEAEAFGARCRQVGIAVRVFEGEGVRCTIGEPEATDLLLRLCAETPPPG
jgi:histidinol-phosphate aminotransferase